MKPIAFVMLMLAGFATEAQKQTKPNLNKVLKLYQEGKYAEAKEMADAATTFEKTMNDGKTWYYRGLIYATIDTIKDEHVRALDPDPFKVSMESFAKAKEMKGKSEYFIPGPDGILPVPQMQQLEILANYHLDRSIKQFQDEQDNEASLTSLNKTTQIFENHMDKYANDTLAYYIAALVAHQAEKPELAVENAQKYFNKGGKSRDIHLVLYQLYSSGPNEDKQKALEVVQNARKARPNDSMWPKVEIELLINMGKEEEAKAGLEQAVAQDPNDKLLHFFLGYVNSKLGNTEDARKNFQDALKLDPSYFEAQFHFANTYLVEVDKVSKELSATGNTPAESKKRSALVQKRVQASEVALPYLEKAEKLKPNDKEIEIELLQKLSLLYYYTADDKNSARIEKRLKELGVSDE